MLQTGRLQTTWFYSWGQLRGQTHGGSGSWTTSKTYLTSSSSEYKRTKSGFILFQGTKVAGQNRWACWLRAYLFMIGQDCHDYLSNHNRDSHCHNFFLSGEWALQVRDATATKWATTFFEGICVSRNKKVTVSKRNKLSYDGSAKIFPFFR